MSLLIIASIVTGIDTVGRTIVWAENTGRRSVASPKRLTLTNPGDLSFSPHMEKVTWFERGSSPFKLHVLDSASQKILWTRTDLPRSELALNSKGTLLFAGKHVLRANTGTQIHAAPAPIEAAVHWSDNGKMAVWMSPTTAAQKLPVLEVWNVERKTHRKIKFPAGSRGYRHLSISPDGRWIGYMCVSQRTMLAPAQQLHLVATDGSGQTHQLPIGKVFTSPIFSPDSKSILINNHVYPNTSSSKEESLLQVWSTDTGVLTRNVPTGKKIYETRWSLDSRLIATHAELTYSVFDASTGKKLWNSPKPFADGEILSLTNNRRLNLIQKEPGKTSPDIKILSKYWNLSKVLPR